MRDILFRGKTKRNEWIYGDLITHGIDFDDAIKQHHTREVWDIIPETVGQYTGLTDKNGKKIFEGDIIKIIYNDRLTRRLELEDYESYLHEYELIEQVVFYKGAFCSMVKVDDIPLYRPLGFDIYEKSMLKAIEVIGNIHDNPDLLRK